MKVSFLTLPIEIRLQIYDYILLKELIPAVYSTRDVDFLTGNFISLYFVCRQTQLECRTMLAQQTLIFSLRFTPAFRRKCRNYTFDPLPRGRREFAALRSLAPPFNLVTHLTLFGPAVRQSNDESFCKSFPVLEEVGLMFSASSGVRVSTLTSIVDRLAGYIDPLRKIVIAYYARRREPRCGSKAEDDAFDGVGSIDQTRFAFTCFYEDIMGVCWGESWYNRHLLKNPNYWLYLRSNTECEQKISEHHYACYLQGYVVDHVKATRLPSTEGKFCLGIRRMTQGVAGPLRHISIYFGTPSSAREYNIFGKEEECKIEGNFDFPYTSRSSFPLVPWGRSDPI